MEQQVQTGYQVHTDHRQVDDDDDDDDASFLKRNENVCFIFGHYFSQGVQGEPGLCGKNGPAGFKVSHCKESV